MCVCSLRFSVNIDVYVCLLPKVLEDDISSHRTSVDSVNAAAKQLMTTVPPQEARLIQDKLNAVNSRYSNVSSATRDHGDGLLALSKKVSDFEKEVDDFEDWLLPDLEVLESEDLMKQGAANTANSLKVSSVIPVYHD